MTQFTHHGMVFVPCGYSFPGLATGWLAPAFLEGGAGSAQQCCEQLYEQLLLYCWPHLHVGGGALSQPAAGWSLSDGLALGPSGPGPG